jgi:hypothetical protein
VQTTKAFKKPASTKGEELKKRFTNVSRRREIDLAIIEEKQELNRPPIF